MVARCKRHQYNREQLIYILCRQDKLCIKQVLRSPRAIIVLITKKWLCRQGANLRIVKVHISSSVKVQSYFFIKHRIFVLLYQPVGYNIKHFKTIQLRHVRSKNFEPFLQSQEKFKAVKFPNNISSDKPSAKFRTSVFKARVRHVNKVKRFRRIALER